MRKKLVLLFLYCFLNSYSQTPVQDFNFNGSLVNKTKTATFNGTAKYVVDKTGNPKGAIRLINESLEANIGNLPQGNSPRTVSIWVKFNDITEANYIWGYGSPLNAKYCGLIHQEAYSASSDLCIAGWGASHDLITTATLVENTWYNYTFTYDGNVSSIYRNGILLKSFKGTNRNTLGSVFKIGKANTLISINADIDDLKIYDIALTREQVASLYDLTPILVSNDEISESDYSNKDKKQ
ncbi:LamG domain-containing protein [Flavobacterium maritimum]|uniref:LamG domain-containing protein n=1 Tax=Flavobacterium maritimum TaxID=3149042 RepID=UPI0032B3D82E